jgi:deoxycytidylate deaminase
MTTRHQTFITRALSLAATSDHHKFKHGAIVTRNNRVLSTGINTKRCPAYIDWAHASVHAEIQALKGLKLGKHVTLYVARVNRYGVPRLSRPCGACWSTLVDSGVSEVVWSLPGGGYEVVKL